MITKLRKPHEKIWHRLCFYFQACTSMNWANTIALSATFFTKLSTPHFIKLIYSGIDK